MPLTAKGKKILSAMKTEYGGTKGTSVFYASANAHKITGVHGMKHDKGFYKHFDLAPMKNNMINTTGGCKEIGQHNTEKHDGHFERTLHSKHNVAKADSLREHKEEVA